jgi:hypothetical protein
LDLVTGQLGELDPNQASDTWAKGLDQSGAVVNAGGGF